MAIDLAKRERLALGPIYLGSLYKRLHECVSNILPSAERYDVALHDGTCFLQIFLWEMFEGVAHNPVEFPPVEMVEVVLGIVRKQKKSPHYMSTMEVGLGQASKQQIFSETN